MDFGMDGRSSYVPSGVERSESRRRRERMPSSDRRRSGSDYAPTSSGEQSGDGASERQGRAPSEYGRMPSARRERPALTIQLSDVEVVIPGPPCSASSRTLAKALALMRSRTICEEDAKQALDVFEAALSGPLQFKGGHLCLAEVYINGSAPQFGKDYRRAITELITFLEVTDVASYGPEVRLAAAREAGRLGQHLDSSGLAPLSKQLTQLAADIPMLQGTALRALISRVERIDGAPCMALALPGAPPPPAGPMDFLNNLLRSVNEADTKTVVMLNECKAQQERLAVLEAMLLREKEKRAEAEELVGRFAASAQQIQNANERLAERVEGEMLRADKAMQDAAVAEMNSEELRREIRRLQTELQVERRKGLPSEQQQPAAGASTARLPTAESRQASATRGGVGTSGAATARQPSAGPPSARQSPVPTIAGMGGRQTAVPDCLEGYKSSRRAASPSPGAESKAAATAAAAEFQDLMQNKRPASPAPQSSRAFTGLREQNGRSNSVNAKREALEAERSKFRSTGAAVFGQAPNYRGENAAPIY
eukprot:TRINITY_DN13460_c0_g1_i1.p1 TRINITY_DN13460_c0_g1~~TRINITY_DN13460_c0_g1_i1.p1  ORF type:complete len:540 (+),score=131.51 TRINITY_DN13460_c0_g1_i1:165-1784(+)